nr:DUF58 domain-containing protein [Desulfobacula sp.]
MRATARFLYRSYSLFHSISFWLQRHITPAGALMAGILLLTGLFGLNMFRTTLYQAMALSLFVLVVSAILSLVPFRPRIRVKHLFPVYGTVGEKLVYSIEITNLGLKPEKGIILYEDPADPRPDLTTLLARKEPYEHLRNAWDRKILYYRWAWLILKSGKARLRSIPLPDLPAGETLRVTSDFTPGFRGYLHFTGVTLARPDALGIFMRCFRIPKAEKLLVLPRRYPLHPPDLRSRRQYHPGGVSLASSIGNSDEFMGLRYYRPGDPLRHIHWRSFARTGELVIKEFEDEFFVRYALILDTFVSPEREAVFEDAVSIAASYAAAVEPHDAILDLMVAGKNMYSFSSGRGLGSSEKMLEILSCIEPCPDKTLLELKPALEAGLKKISGAVCIFSGWDRAHEEILRMIREALVPVFVVVIAADASHKAALERKTRNLDHRVRVVQTGKISEGLSAP